MVGLVTLAVGMVLGAAGCDRTQAASETQPVSTQPVTLTRELTLDLGDGVGIKLVLIPAGKFTMGSPPTEKGRMWGEDQHEVTINNPFYMGMYPVTVDQYSRFVRDTGRLHQNPRFPQAGDHPVACVSWDDAQAFCKWSSKKTGRMVALPSDAQWEYACRAGSATKFYFGDNDDQLGDYAWFAGNSGNTTHPVGRKKPNAWGLYDMHGNVCQWCLDYLPSYNKGPNDFDWNTGLRVRDFKVIRGGTYAADSTWCRDANRGGGVHDDRRPPVYGFRIIVTTMPDPVGTLKGEE
jgi:formylglycine-generating enzyme required for sulfatase activity